MGSEMCIRDRPIKARKLSMSAQGSRPLVASAGELANMERKTFARRISDTPMYVPMVPSGAPAPADGTGIAEEEATSVAEEDNTSIGESMSFKTE